MTLRPRSQLRPFRALALEPRILLDAAVVETAKEVAQQSSEAADWDSPGFSATPVDMNLTVTDTNDEFPAIDLFNDVSVEPNSIWGEDETNIDEETGELISRPLRDLTITVSATGASHALVVDGTTIALQSTELPGTTANSFYTYTVSVSGNTTTIVVAINSSNLPVARTSEGAAALIDSIAYQAQDLGVATGDLSVSLKLDDTSGAAAEGRITSTIHITRDSDLPVAPGLTTQPTLEAAETFDGSKGLPGADQVTYSTNGKYAYSAGAGTFATFSVDATGRLALIDSISVANLGSVETLIASSDGKSLYSLSTNGQLVEMSINANGTLSHVGTYAVSSNSSGSLAISADGSQLYADGGDNQRAVQIYARDTTTGRLLVSQHLPSITVSGTAYDALNGGAGNYSGASVSIARSSGANIKDGYSFATLYYYDEQDRSSGTLSYRDGEIFYDDYSGSEKSIATFTVADGTLNISFTAEVSTRMVNRVLNQISFQTSDSTSVVMALKVDSYAQSVLLDGGSYELQPVQAINDAIRQTTIIQAGNYLYVVNNGGSLWDNRTLEVYQRNSDGKWTVLDNVTKLNAETDWGSTSDPIAVSADGLYVYVSAHGSGTLDVYQLNTTSGFLSPVNSIALSGQAENAASISLSDDGKALYVVTDDGTASVYAVSGSRLTLQGSVVGIASGDMSLSRDGLSLIVANGEGITRYSLARSLTLGDSLTFADRLTLSDANSDELSNHSGDYNGASIVITPSVASGAFSLIESSGLKLSAGTILYNDAAIATFATAADGTLTVTFTAATSTAVANQVLQQITYTNADPGTAGTLITLSLQASDGMLTSETQTITLRVNTLPTLDTDVATGYLLRNVTSDSAYSFTLFSGLFGDLDGDVLTWTVSGLPQGLTFNAQTRTISGITSQTGTFTLLVSVTDASGHRASVELALDVVQIANRAPEVNADISTTLSSFTESQYGNLTLDSKLFTDADAVYGDTLSWSVSGLPQGLSFDAATLTITGAASAVGNYLLTVTATDSAGKTAQAELTLRVIGSAEAANHAPGLSADASSLVYANGSLSGYGANGTYINGLVLSGDETILTVASSTGNNGNGDHFLNIYRRDTATGALTLLQVFKQGASDDPNTSVIEVDGLQNVTSVTYSADGKQLFLTGYNSTGNANSHALVAFNVNDDGTLSYLGHSDNLAEKILHVSVDETSGALYALSANRIYVYSAGSDGKFSMLGTYAPDSSFGTAVTMRVEGDTAYVLSGSRLTLYRIADDGLLSYSGQLIRSNATLTYTDASGASGEVFTMPSNNAFSGAVSMTVSADGYIYLVTTNGYLTTLHYDSAANDLRYVEASGVTSFFGGQQAYGVTVSADGTALYVVSAATSNLLIFSIGDDGKPVNGRTLGINGGGSRVVVSADGSSVYVGKHMFFGTVTLSSVQANGIGSSYTEGGAAILPAASITLSDLEYDSLENGSGNYKGGTITIARSGGDNPLDIFGFSDGNGLALGNGSLTLDGAEIASFESKNGRLTITFSANVSSATANAVLQQISYRNDSDNPGSQITLQVTAGDEYTSSSIDVKLAVTEINNAPSLSATPIEATYVSGAASGVKLFEDTQVSAGEPSQTIRALQLTVTGLSSTGVESLTIDGTTIALSSGSRTTTNGYGVSVSFNSETGSATVSITSSAGMAVADVAKLVDNITYTSNADTSGSRTVTLTTIQDNGGTSHGGVDTAMLAIAATVTLGTANTAPTLTGTGSSVAYIENETAVELFSGTLIDTGESGQTIASLRLTVSGLADGQHETLRIDGTTVALTHGSVVTTVNGHIVTVTLENGSAVVSISSSNASGIAVAEMQAIVNAISYANSSEDPTEGSRVITLSSLSDNGGHANGGSDTSALDIRATVEVIAVNDAPLLQSTPTQAVYAASGSSAALFFDTRISTVESSQSISAITVTASGLLNGRNETLTVDGTRIVLVNDTTATASGYSVTVSVDSAGTATVIIGTTVPGGNASGISAADAAALINGISYVNVSGTYSAGERGFTLAVQDSGGTAHGGSDSTGLRVSARLLLENNSAPVLSSTPDHDNLVLVESYKDISGLTNVIATALNTSGTVLYAISSEGAIAIFSRNASTGALVYGETVSSGLSSASDVQFSADGRNLYVLGNTGDAIAIFARSAVDDSLQSVQLLETTSVQDFAVAADGALYVVDGNYSGLLVYTWNEDGQYVLVQQIAANANSEPYLFTGVDVEVVGEHVYVITDPAATGLADTLIVYSRASDGKLGNAVYLRDGADGSNAVLRDPLDLAVSSDGNTIYVATASGVSIFSIANGMLTQTGTISGLSDIHAIALASDGVTLYVSSGESISRYDVRDATATVLLQTLTDIGDVTSLSTAANGTLIASAGDSLENLQNGLVPSLAINYQEHGHQLIASNLTLADAEHDAMNDGTGNYQGASLTVTRSGGAQPDDSYALIAGNGLSVDNGQVLHDGTVVASFLVENGRLTIAFTSNASGAIANQVLQQISYHNTSNDPGPNVSLVLTVADAYSSSDSVTLELAVTQVNDAPTLTSKGATATYTEGAGPTALFSDTLVSTIEAGQSITGLTLAVAGVTDGGNETLTIDGTVIKLTTGSGTTTSGYAYSVSLTDGTASITITTGAGVTSQTAATLVDGIAYAHTSNDPTSGTRSITLTGLQDSGGTDHGGADSAPLAVAASVTLIAVNDAPSATASGLKANFTEGDSAVSLFSGAAVSTIEAEQRITGMTLTVAGLADGSNESLTIAGARIALVSGTTTVNGYIIEVSTRDGIATVTVTSAAGLSADAAAALIDGLAYANNSSNPSENLRTITLTSITDSGGGADTSALAITATVEVLSVNEAPVATDEAFQLNAATWTGGYSVTLPATLFNDGDGDLLSWSVSGLPAGLVFNAENRTISGNVTASPGDYSLIVVVTDPSGETASRTLTLTVDALAYIAPATLTAADSSSNGSTPTQAPLSSALAMDRTTSSPAHENLKDFLKAASTGTFAHSGELLDSLLPPAWSDAPGEPASMRLADGSTSTLAVLATSEGPDLAVRQTSVSGHWTYDPAANRMVFKLPAGLFASRVAVLSIELHTSDGSALPSGLRLDTVGGSLSIAGMRSASMDLQLLLKTADGRSLSLPVHIDPARTAIHGGVPAKDALHAKPALTEQLRHGPATDLLAQARALLSRLADDTPQANQPSDAVSPDFKA
ncbi:beta-propeller fold lactonase family protein [Comamonas sp. Tr-654]|uniref:beta strand repeat-containing protein n=1 Tax=Comamonas sp. Tr-654 TaxID=2608341 RepID=UPI00141DB23A|nr:putative Ig domain-containing protein [Comamonas sp. Tr-654]NIF86052.1 beta-propeller fold lactonase family protein [Comamonas sp. Tr-654]